MDAPQFIDRLHGQALGNDGLLLLTDDGGQQWRGVHRPGPGAVLFASARTGWTLAGNAGRGDARSFVTTDGGATWRPLPSLPVYRVDKAWVLGPDRLLANGYTLSDNEALSFLSEDGGRSWRQLGLQFTGVTPTGLLYAEEFYRLRLSTNGGATSRTIASYPLSGEPLAKDLSDPARLQLLMGTTNGIEHRTSSDGGLTWTITSVVTPPGLSLSPSWDGLWLEGSSGWAVGYTPSYDRALLHSTDGGRHWSVAALPAGVTGQGDIQTLRFHGPSLLTLEGYGGVAWASSDGAQTWQPVRPPGDPSKVVQIGDAGGGVLQLAMGETKVTSYPGCIHSRCIYTETIIHRRYVSADGGATWRLMPGGWPLTP